MFMPLVFPTKHGQFSSKHRKCVRYFKKIKMCGVKIERLALCLYTYLIFIVPLTAIQDTNICLAVAGVYI